MTKRISGIPQRKILLGCSVLAALWYGSFLWGGRPVKLLGAPDVFYFGVDREQTLAQLHNRTAFHNSSGPIYEADVQVFVVMNWDQLEAVDGLREFCGEPCSPNSDAVLVRKNILQNLIAYQKLVFVRIGDMVEQEAGNDGHFTYPGSIAACLWDGLAKEIEQARFLSVTEGCFGANLRGKAAVNGSRGNIQAAEQLHFTFGF
ncbi:MAG: hypothetical protein AB3N24_20585 [Leisingera sp.]